MAAAAPLLELRDIAKHFDGIRAVDGVTVQLQQGELVGLIGPNGSGKSTLLNLISGVHKPTRGAIFFRGERIDRLQPYEIFARGIIRSFQTPGLFTGMTVFENTCVPPRGQRGEIVRYAPFPHTWESQERQLGARALDVLRRFQLHPVRLNLANQVSGGQMKLLEISRALMETPQLMLLDEPTAGVAPKLAQEIFEHIQRAHREGGLTFLIIEHRLEILFDYVHRALVLHEGRVIYDGPPDGVYRDPQVIDAYLGG